MSDLSNLERLLQEQKLQEEQEQKDQARRYKTFIDEQNRLNESDEYNKSLIQKSIDFFSRSKWFFRFISGTSYILKLAAHSYEITKDFAIVAKDLVPPLSAAFYGFLITLEIIEALFFSRETLNRRAFKIGNSICALGLTIASGVIMTANLPLGAALAAGAMAVSSIKEGFFWYKASKDLTIAKKNLLESNSNRVSSQKINELTAEVNRCRQVRNEKRRLFINNALSCVAMTLVALTAFAVAGAILVNPITLGIAAISALSLTLVSGIYNVYKKYSEKKQSAILPTAQTPKAAHQLDNDPIQDQPTASKSLKSSLSMKHESDTVHLISDLVQGKKHANYKKDISRTMSFIRDNKIDDPKITPTPASRSFGNPTEKSFSPNNPSPGPQKRASGRHS